MQGAFQTLSHSGGFPRVFSALCKEGLVSYKGTAWPARRPFPFPELTGSVSWQRHRRPLRPGYPPSIPGTTGHTIQPRPSPGRACGRLMECLAAGYEEILIDFGSVGKQVSIELTRCSAVWFIMSFSEWQMDAFCSHAFCYHRAVNLRKSRRSAQP